MLSRYYVGLPPKQEQLHLNKRRGQISCEYGLKLYKTKLIIYIHVQLRAHFKKKESNHTRT